MEKEIITETGSLWRRGSLRRRGEGLRSKRRTSARRHARKKDDTEQVLTNTEFVIMQPPKSREARHLVILTGESNYGEGGGRLGKKKKEASKG